MTYTMQLTDSSGTVELPLVNVPLTESTIEGVTDVTTLDLNIYTDFFATKKEWSHTWRYMTDEDFEIIKGFYDRQWTNYEYPLLTIEDLGIEDQPVRMSLSPQRIIDKCGTVENVEVNFRQTVANTPTYTESS